MASGVYQINCLINNRNYIGSAVNLTQRWRKHKEALKRGNHHNSYLQRTWNKYDQKDFKFTILEYCNSINLVEREQHWINIKDSANKKKGFNLCPIAGSLLGFKRSEESKLKVAKTYIVTDPLGKELEITNLNKFCKENNLPQSNFATIVSGTIGQHKGWKCRHSHVSKQEWELLVAKKAKSKWHLINPEGKEFWVRSKELTEFCQNNGLSVQTLHSLKGKNKTKGWTVKYYKGTTINIDRKGENNV